MGEWTLLHVDSPLNLISGTGLHGELTKASSRSLSYTLSEGDTLSFSLPGNHPQTAAIEPMVSDILPYRDGEPFGRFRVVSRSIAKGEKITANFAAVSYKTLLKAWIIRDGDQRSWPTATDQSLIAWTIFSAAQARPNSNLGVTRGHVATSVTRVLVGAEEDGKRAEYFEAGTTVYDAIQSLAEMDQGFEWDITVDYTNATTLMRAMKFEVWPAAEGLRGGSTNAMTTLADGSQIASWTHTVTPTDFANVVRVTGGQSTDENTNAGVNVPAWYPTTKNPVTPDPRGRWERSIGRTDATSNAAITAAAKAEYVKAFNYVPELALEIARGQWLDPDGFWLWIGVNIRVLITEPVVEAVDGIGLVQGEGYVIYIDENMRAVEVDISIDDLGAETVVFGMIRPRSTSTRTTMDLYDRVRRLERR